jgi:polyhydroxybutyrate depolymerase
MGLLAMIWLPAVLALAEAAGFYGHNRHNGSLMSSGRTREFVLHVPTSYDAGRPAPLVISLHGGSLWGAAQRDISSWDRVADEQGIIVVYPSGIGGRGPRAWRAGEAGEQSVDVRFISDLIDTLSARYRIDPARMYADGMSNGGGMAFALACGLSTRVAAVGLVAPAVFLRWNGCAGRRPVPMIVFHGTADRFIPYEGGKSFVAPDVLFPSIPEFVATWARRNGCAAAPVDSVLGDEVTRRAFGRCASQADVALYTIRGGGHTWPGGPPLAEWFVGRTSTTINATRLMWDFFREHPLQR